MSDLYAEAFSGRYADVYREMAELEVQTHPDLTQSAQDRLCIIADFFASQVPSPFMEQEKMPCIATPMLITIGGAVLFLGIKSGDSNMSILGGLCATLGFINPLLYRILSKREKRQLSDEAYRYLYARFMADSSKIKSEA